MIFFFPQQEHNSIHSHADWSNTSWDAARTDHGKDLKLYYDIIMYSLSLETEQLLKLNLSCALLHWAHAN